MIPDSKFTKIFVEQLTAKLGRSTAAIRNYLSKDILTWHEKDRLTGRKLVFYEECVEVRWHFLFYLMNQDIKQSQIGPLFVKVFGQKDEDLILAFDEGHKLVEDVIKYFTPVIDREK